MWNNTKPNPFSFERFPDGSGRVWSWQYCKDEDCDLCWVTEGGINVVPLQQCGQELFLLNYDAWVHEDMKTWESNEEQSQRLSFEDQKESDDND